MTEPQSVSGQPLPPIEQPKSRYTGFYLTMLILSTVGTALSMFGLAEIATYIGYLNEHTVYAVTMLVSLVVVLPVSVVALVLLWLKKLAGIWLKLGTYVASIVAAIVTLFSGSDVLKLEAEKVLQETASAGIPASTVNALVSGMFYVALVFGIIISIVFALLWWFAWRKQRQADTEE